MNEMPSGFGHKVVTVNSTNWASIKAEEASPGEESFAVVTQDFPGETCTIVKYHSCQHKAYATDDNYGEDVSCFGNTPAAAWEEWLEEHTQFVGEFVLREFCAKVKETRDQYEQREWTRLATEIDAWARVELRQ